MKILREYIRHLLQERIVNFDGVEYDIPDEEIQRIKDQLQMGYVGIGMDPEPPDRSYDVDETVESVLDTVPEESQEKVRSVLNVYGKSLKNTLVKTIYNYGEEVSSQFFTIAPTFGDHSFPSAAWNDIVNIHQPGRSNAIGRGEAALALALTGVVPDSGSGVHDLEIEGLGGVHVKDTGASGGLRKPDVPMGKGLSGEDMSRPWYQSVKRASRKAGFKFGRGLGTTLLQKNSKAILDEFAALTGDTSQNYDALADAWEDDIVDSFRNSESWGNSGAVIFVDKGGLGFSIVPPEEAYPTRIENNGWRVGKASAYPNGRFATALKSGSLTNEGDIKQLVRSLLSEISLGQSYGTVKYTALILDSQSHTQLAQLAPEGWRVYSHHMTVINPPNQKRRLPARWLGVEECVTITAIAQNDQVITGLVDLGNVPIPMKGPSFPHITIATNPQAGGKPMMSNQFSMSDFEPIAPIRVCGTIEEVS